MSGTLYVVATPIGNLEDITLRAIRVLREVALIAAEDTRRTSRLLQHHGIATPTTSFHEHNARARLPQLIGRLSAGDSIALVTDAGTPSVSDPGVELVRACVEAGIPVDPIPGPSATLAALVASGFQTNPVTFMGFPPSRSSDRKRFLQSVASVPHTVVLFEAPHRIRQFLADACAIFGNRPLFVARELTKLHQELYRGTATDLVNAPIVSRGEFTVVVGPGASDREVPLQLPGSAEVAAEFRQLTDVGRVTRRQAIATLSRKYRRPSREIYARIEDAKQRLP